MFQVWPLHDQLHVHACLTEEAKKSGKKSYRASSSARKQIKQSFFGVVKRGQSLEYSGCFWTRNSFTDCQNPFSEDKTVTWFWRLREIFDGQKTKGDRLPLENMLEGLISQVSHKEYDKDQAASSIDAIAISEIWNYQWLTASLTCVGARRCYCI